MRPAQTRPDHLQAIGITPCRITAFRRQTIRYCPGYRGAPVGSQRSVTPRAIACLRMAQGQDATARDCRFSATSDDAPFALTGDRYRPIPGRPMPGSPSPSAVSSVRPAVAGADPRPPEARE